VRCRAGGLRIISLAVGATLRHSAGAITTVIGLVIFPIIAGATLSIQGSRWLTRFTLSGGFALLRAKPPTDAPVEAWSRHGRSSAQSKGLWWLGSTRLQR